MTVIEIYEPEVTVPRSPLTTGRGLNSSLWGDRGSNKGPQRRPAVVGVDDGWGAFSLNWGDVIESFVHLPHYAAPRLLRDACAIMSQSEFPYLGDLRC